MGKRGVLTLILAFIAVFCAYAAYAEHSAGITATPLQIYETNTGIFNLIITNTAPAPLFGFDILGDDSKSTIKNISILYNHFTLLASTIPSDWTRSLANDVLAYASNYSGISSGGVSFPLAIQAKADKVDEDTNAVWRIITKDLNNDTVENSFQILIINDTTPPEISDIFPYDGLYVKKGTNNQELRITAFDNETGMYETKFNYDDCAFLNDTKHVVLANSSPDLYTGTADLASYEDSTQVCFSFNAENNGGALAVYPGRLTIDGFPPTVTLLSPADGALMNSQSAFEFIAVDNLAPNMTCELLVDGNVEGSMDVLNNVISSFSVADASEGRHKWSVKCTDLAGWDTTSETRTYILDRTPPSVRLSFPPYLIMAMDTTLQFVVTDNFVLDGIVYSYSNFSTSNPNYEYVNITMNKSAYTTANESHFTISTNMWEEGYHDITVWADDAAGNNWTETIVVIIDKTAPSITLISPEDGQNSTTDAEFVFNATDNFDDFIDCTLYVNDITNGTTIVNTTQNVTGVIRSVLGPANYSWYIECEDDAGNANASETRDVTVVDTVGPEITFNNVGIVVRGNDIVVNAVIMDISGVNPGSIHATMEDANNVTVDIILEGEDGTDNYVGVYPTSSSFPLGDYIARISAEDIFGNQNSNYAIYNLTYAYVVAFTLSPNPVYTGQQVTASGTVAMDDGQAVQDGTVTLTLPESTADAAVSAGTFTSTFNAPGTANTYTITAAITAPNGFAFDAQQSLEVQTQSDNKGNTDGGDGGDSGGDSTSDFGCGVNKAPDENGRCVDVTEQTPPPTIVSLPGQSNAPDHSNSGVVTFASCGDGNCDQNENCNICSADCGECQKKTNGIGKAAGFFDLSKVSSSLLWLLLVLAIMAFVLLYLYEYGFPDIKPTQTMQASQPVSPVTRRPKFRLFGRKDHLGIDRYMEKRNKP